MSQTEPRRCTLGLAVGAVEACTLERCAFWEPGGAVVEGGCVIDRLALDVRRPDVAVYLLEVREQLKQDPVCSRSWSPKVKEVLR
jgi:hypothetical protein